MPLAAEIHAKKINCLFICQIVLSGMSGLTNLSYFSTDSIPASILDDNPLKMGLDKAKRIRGCGLTTNP